MSKHNISGEPVVTPPGVYRCALNHVGCEGCDNQKIDNSVKVLEKIAGLYAERLLSDIVLEVNGKQYASHRLILCASSDVFQVMLMNPNWSESQEKTIVLQEEDDCAKVFPEFLKYLYTGIININHNLVLPLASLADKYNVRDLVSLCVEYMRKHIVSATKHHKLVSWLHYVLTSGHEVITNACVEFVASNFEAVSEMKDFIAIETDVLIAFLKKSELVVTDEYKLFLIAAKWLEAQELRLKLVGDEFFDTMVEDVMKNIRFPMIEPRQLADLLLNPLMNRYNNFFLKHMSLAMSYHNNSLSPQMRTQLPPLSFTARLYTTEKWSSSLLIENYKNLPVYGVRTLVFNTPAALSEAEQKRCQRIFSDNYCSHEWAVEVYPKGVWFKKFLLINWTGPQEVPEFVSRIVRLTVRQTQSTVREHSRRVSIGILLFGRNDDIEYVHRVVRRSHVFTENEKVLNIDDVIPFEELNEFRSAANAATNGGNSGGNRSPFLVGADSDTLKVRVIITPLSDN